MDVYIYIYIYIYISLFCLACCEIPFVHPPMQPVLIAEESLMSPDSRARVILGTKGTCLGGRTKDGCLVCVSQRQ